VDGLRSRHHNAKAAVDPAGRREATHG
jgi:hypothetical protein